MGRAFFANEKEPCSYGRGRVVSRNIKRSSVLGYTEGGNMEKEGSHWLLRRHY